MENGVALILLEIGTEHLFLKCKCFQLPNSISSIWAGDYGVNVILIAS